MARGRTRFLVAFLALPLLLYGTFVLYPAARGVVVSFTDWSGYSHESAFIGFDNYVELVGDERFWAALVHNLVYFVVLPPVTLGIALFFAVVTHIAGGRRGRIGPVAGSRFYSVVFFLPNILPLIMSLILWQFIFNPRIGLLNAVLEAMGLEGWVRTWLGDPDTARWAIFSVLVWGTMGFFYVFFSAAISGIPRDYLEAGQLDGAGRFRLSFSVTLPMMRESLQVAWVYVGIFALDVFATVALLTPNGGPDGSTDVTATYMQRVAFAEGRFGYGATIGVALAVITLAFAFLAFRLGRRERIEYEEVG
ncbi:carbohydrate ABC transporter permease [Microbacterium sp.]|uniref:carbohydrate ABC transporter permease n=1 Tax=Microbacterium sp. TaxID=51671 RepID=UPI003A870B5B